MELAYLVAIFFGTPVIALFDWYLFTQIINYENLYTFDNGRYMKATPSIWHWIIPCFIESSLMLAGISIGIAIR